MPFKTILVPLIGLLWACGSPGSLAPEGGEAAEADAAALRMPVSRAAHKAIAASDGRVLLVGGCVAASCESGPASATVDAFDPRTGTFAPAGTLTARRVSSAAVPLANGEILIAGGWVGSAVSSSVEIFDPRTGKSREVGQLAEPRADIAAVRLADGRVLLAGGYGNGRPKAAIELFDPRTSTLIVAGQLAVPRASAGAVQLKDGRVLIVGGGADGPGRVVPTGAAEIFDPATGRTARTADLAHARYKHAVVAVPDGSILVLGGSDGRDSAGKLRAVEKYDPETGLFTPAGNLLDARYKIAEAVVLLPGGKLLVAGGADRAELYDPSSLRSVHVGPSFGGALNFGSATLMRDGSVLVAGGYYEDGIRMNDRAWLLAANEF